MKVCNRRKLRHSKDRALRRARLSANFRQVFDSRVGWFLLHGLHGFRSLAVIGALASYSTLSSASAPDPKVESSAVREPKSVQPPNTALRYGLPVDISITVGAGALALSLELLASKLSPSTCNWCDRSSDGRDSLNRFDASIRNGLRWNNTRAADTASTVIGYGIVPLTSVGLGALLVYRDHRTDEFLVDALLVAEATAIALNVNQITKFAFARERPEVHFRSATDRAALRSTEDNLSFYSGHTTFAFALAASTATVASMRRYRLAPVVWVAGMLLASTTGYLRIAADKHYATDVITGAVAGTAIGVGIPYLAHRPTASGTSVTVTTMPVASGAGFMVAGSW
jgi:membrane-associated phospholipid phosphatase